MFRGKAHCFWLGVLLQSSSLVHAQTPDAIVQQVVDTERAANQSDHSKWMYFEDARKPKEDLRQWVVMTSHGDVRRVTRKNDLALSRTEQRDAVDRFVHDAKAQEKQVAETAHDNQQVDDFLKLLPTAFRWTRAGTTATEISLHFEPNPDFHPPTREARVFSGMTGDLTVDREQKRIRRLDGHLIHDVTFGGGLLGRLKTGSSFALEQVQVAASLWQLTAIHVHLEGNALLFKSVSLQEDDERSRFEQQTSALTLDEAATIVMKPEN